MTKPKSRHIATAPTLIIASALLLGSPTFAETVHFRVAFESVPGIEEIEAGDLQAAIKVLEDQLAKTDSESSGDILATLCAAYIVNRSLDKAERACAKALEIKPTKTAYNNRGVLRAHRGDFSGAREDFDRVRPHQLDVYLEELWVKDVPLMAEDNFGLIDELLSKGASLETNRSFALNSATIEDLTN